jgi:hypothetical protein
MSFPQNFYLDLADGVSGYLCFLEDGGQIHDEGHQLDVCVFGWWTCSNHCVRKCGQHAKILFRVPH